MLTMGGTIRQFWKDLSVLVNAGLPLKEALNLILRNSNNSSSGNRFNQALTAIIVDLETDLTFYEALSQNPDFFGPVEINLVRSGEIFGDLEVKLYQLNHDLTLTKADEYKNFYASLGTCLSAGIPILTSFKVTKGFCTGNLKKVVGKLYRVIENGGVFITLMAESGLFCEGEISLVDLGEQTGSLANTFLELAKACSK